KPPPRPRWLLDSYRSINALAETVNGYYKAELIRGPAREGRPWKTVEDVELATLSWVHWHNHERLHGYLADVPPAEFEQSFYATKRTDQTLGMGYFILLSYGLHNRIFFS
ncbi:MAG: integrase core domain-containing protein, partial [Ginsengibacter sp.]